MPKGYKRWNCIDGWLDTAKTRKCLICEDGYIKQNELDTTPAFYRPQQEKPSADKAGEPTWEQLIGALGWAVAIIFGLWMLGYLLR